MTEIVPAPAAPPPAGSPETEAPDAIPGPLLPLGDGELLDPAAIAARLESLAAVAARYAEKASGAGTRRAYGAAWDAFATWCQRHGLEPLAGDPGIVALYLTARAKDGLAVSSLGVARAAIRARHRMAKVPLDLDDPRITLVMRGVTNTKGKRPKRKAAPAVPALLRRMIAACPFPESPAASADALAARHRAMLLIGFGAGLRRSELTALAVGDVSPLPGRPAGFSGHSLRRGLLTDAGDRREQLRDVMRHSRHVKVETALGYMEESEIWRDNITEGVFARRPGAPSDVQS